MATLAKEGCSLFVLPNIMWEPFVLSVHGKPPLESENSMKNTDTIEPDTDMLPEYDFDYSKSKPNRFAEIKSNVTIVLDSDVAAVFFSTSEAVNKALRAILSALPK